MTLSSLSRVGVVDPYASTFALGFSYVLVVLGGRAADFCSGYPLEGILGADSSVILLGPPLFAAALSICLLAALALERVVRMELLAPGAPAALPLLATA